MMDILRAIFFTILCGDFLLAVGISVIFKLTKRREASENRQIRSILTNSGETDAQRHIREAQENAEAWRQMQNYSAKDAYGSDGG